MYNLLNIRIMKKLFFAISVVFACTLCSCGGSKKVANSDYYNNPQGYVQSGQQQTVNQTRQRRTVDPMYTLAKQEGERMRATQSATSHLEDVALDNAESAAAQALASRLETAIMGVRDRYNRTTQVNNQVMTEQDAQNHVKSYFAQKISYVVIGEPSIYDNSNGTITAYVCVEMKTKTEDVLSEAYDNLTREGVIAVEYDKKKFIEENKEELKKLQQQIGL